MVGTEELSSINCPDFPSFKDGARASCFRFFYRARSQALLALKQRKGWEGGGGQSFAYTVSHPQGSSPC